MRSQPQLTYLDMWMNNNLIFHLYHTQPYVIFRLTLTAVYNVAPENKGKVLRWVFCSSHLWWVLPAFWGFGGRDVADCRWGLGTGRTFNRVIFPFTVTASCRHHALPVWQTWTGWPSAWLPSPRSSAVYTKHTRIKQLHAASGQPYFSILIYVCQLYELFCEWVFTCEPEPTAASSVLRLCVMCGSRSWWWTKALKWNWKLTSHWPTLHSLTLHIPPCWVSVGQLEWELWRLYLFWICSCWKANGAHDLGQQIENMASKKF